MEYASHVWGGFTHPALLNRVESKTFRLINSFPLTDCLQPLVLFYRYFHANCSSDLANCMPPLLSWNRCTRLASSPDPYPVHLCNTKVNQCSQSFIPFSSKLWNSTPTSVFQSAYNLNSFKREVSRHLTQSFGHWSRTFPRTSTSVGCFLWF